MLEEKSKLVEAMNEANNLFEEGTRSRSFSLNEQIQNRSICNTEGFDSMIKPGNLDIADQTKSLTNMPYDVKFKIQAHTEHCTALSFSATGDTIATGGADKIVNIWNTKNMNIKCTLRSKESICALAYSIDN